jgi:hypothetical protein
MDNIYVVELNEKGTTNQLITSLLHKEKTLAAMESTNILQEEDDENISVENKVYEEENEAIVPPKLGDVLEPPKDDSNTKTQNSIAIYEAPYTFCERIQNLDNPSYFDAPLLASNDISEIIDD